MNVKSQSPTGQQGTEKESSYIHMYSPPINITPDTDNDYYTTKFVYIANRLELPHGYITPTRRVYPTCLNCKKESILEVHDCKDVGCFLHCKKIIPIEEANE